jgi:signal transduction histidine kinase
VTLRRRLSIGMVLIGLVGLIACATLAATASLLHSRVLDLSTAIESVEAADELSVLLTAHYRSPDPIVRASFGPTVDAAIARARENVQSPEEAALITQLDDEVHRYLASPSDTPLFEGAYGTTRRLGALNVAQARGVSENARRSDAWGRAIAIASSAFIILALAFGLLWLRLKAFVPFVALERGMRRFAEGDYDARVVETGAPEARAMARTFNQMALALGRARQRQLQYVASVVHDLRNPLSVLQLAAGALGRSSAVLDRRMQKTAALIRRQIVRMSSIVGDLLNAARIEAGELVLKTADVDLRSVAEEVVDLFQQLAPLHVITLDSPKEVVVECDRSRIEQVINNLVSNAIKYSPAGSRVDIKLRSSAEGCEIEVRDQGPGLAPEERARIFDPFFRTSATHEEAAGAGLGLFATQRIVEAHGGRIDVASRLGEGSVFTVFLPRVPKEVSAAPHDRSFELEPARAPEPA